MYTWMGHLESKTRKTSVSKLIHLKTSMLILVVLKTLICTKPTAHQSLVTKVVTNLACQLDRVHPAVINNIHIGALEKTILNI